MNLPFSPTFFRKMDIFQQLMEYEGQKKNKHLWEGEKAVLIWGASDQHQHLGSALGTNHVKKALDYCAEHGYMTEDEKNRLNGSVSYILESLAIHEFGKQISNPAINLDLQLNRNGILAGEILIETNNLLNPQKYNMWKLDWFLVYYLAGLLLMIQVIKGFIDLILEIKKYVF